MKICLTSDTHGTLPKIPECDLLIHAGDLTAYGLYDEFMTFLASVPPGTIFTAGNHDKWIADNPAEAVKIAHDHGCHLLLDNGVAVSDVLFYGAPWSPRFGRWSFMYNRGTHDWKIPKCDVLITHGPPLGIGDDVGARHTGCLDLLNAVATAAPKLHVFGHIHEGYGVYQVEDLPTVFINAAHRDGGYVPCNPPIMVTI